MVLVGGIWLIIDVGVVMFDGKLGCCSCIYWIGSLFINVMFVEGLVLGIVVLFGFNVLEGVLVSVVGVIVMIVCLFDGIVCVWLFLIVVVMVSSVVVMIDILVMNVEVGEIVIFCVVDIGIKDGWMVGLIDVSVYMCIKGG